ncbi:MAG: DHH family phosphoesterase [Clostridia bacterium]|nr:DHH family phosphoesterase [Clostridia bacterium]
MKKLWKIYDLSIIYIVAAFVVSGLILLSGMSIPALTLAVITVMYAVGKYVYYKKVREKLLYKINTVSTELDFSNGKAFEKLVVPCVVIEADGSIIWFNGSFKEQFNISNQTKALNLKQLIHRDSIDKLILGRGFKIKVDNMFFSIYSNDIELTDETIYLLYFFDETKLRITEKEYYDTRPAIMLSVIDNADEIYQNFKESDCAVIFSRIEGLIDDWVSSYGGLCRKFSNARMLFFVEERALQKMINDKFNILDKIREFTFDGKSVDITLSIGVGKDESLIESNNSARQALDMAQSRGGDQVAIKHVAQYKFYGGVSAGFEKKNKVRTRLIAKTVSEIITTSDNVLIMGHRFSDFDAFGSATGMYAIATHFGKDAHIVLNRESTLAGPLVDRFIEEKGDKVIISPDNADRYIKENTLLIVVDTHKKDFTEYPDLVDKANRVMVIDHHRKSVDFIEDTVLFYHMPNSSSAAEMVTELAQYIDSKPVLDSFTASALFAGIMLDTRNFVLRAGVRTFEAAAYLRSRGANTVDSKKMFSNDMEIFRHRNAIIDSARTYRECAVSVAPGDIENIRLVTSQACDEMLNIDGVKSTFVLYPTDNGVNISARSYGEMNVQLIMESLGGGGHQTMSACQLRDITMSQAIEKLEKAIDKYISNL